MSGKKQKRKMDLEEQDARLEEIERYLLDFDRMKERCTAPLPAYRKMLEELPNTAITDTADGMLAHIDRGGTVLGVAHLDATGAKPHFGTVKIEDEWWVFTRWVDDRLGAFLLLDVLPKLGLRYDILLTTGEENGRSTAYYFETEKNYRWMFELDRMEGWANTAHAVYYQYRTEALSRALKQAGIERQEHGSYTDIVELEHLGACGFNLAIGYTDNHNTWARANLRMTAIQVERLWRFFQQNEESVFPFDPHAATGRRRRGLTAVYMPPAIPSENWTVWKKNGHEETDSEKKEAKITVFGGDLLRDKKSKQLYRVSKNASTTWDRFQHVMGWWCHHYYRVAPHLSDRPVEGGCFKYENEIDVMIGEDWKIARLEWEALTGEKVSSVRAENDPFDDDPEKTQPVKVISTARNKNSIESAEYDRISKLCDGLPTEKKTIEARLKFEIWMYGNLSTHSCQRPLLDRHQAAFKCGDKVHTPFGIGYIDSDYPCIPMTEDPAWWVRFTVADKQGLYVTLVDDVELTLALPPATSEIHHDSRTD